jgi:conjugal transfer pilus assembly protein TraW
MANFLKPMSFLFVCASFFSASYADTIAIKDHGVYGTLFEIEEEDMLQLMMKRLNALKESGKLEAFQEAIVKKAKKQALEPKALTHITHTKHKRVFTFDPSLKIQNDVIVPKEVNGQEVVLARKGDIINPLDKVTPAKGFLFIDGDDPKQQDLIKEMSKRFDIVLVKGKPLTLQEKMGVQIFFDQGGALTKRFGIRHVPATFEVDPKNNKQFRVTEFVP